MNRSFASDNTSAVHPLILKSLEKANQLPFAKAYGDDEVTAEATRILNNEFGPTADVHFVFNGTGANVLLLATLLKPFQSVLTPENSHLNVDECGALERFCGARVLAVPAKEGKLRSSDLERYLRGRHDQHRSQPGVVSISNSTEEGRVYSPAEIKSLADFTHHHGMLLHVDGARFANAAASLNLGLRELSADLGVDALSFGGTKNGLMFGEAAIFFKRPESADFRYIRKQGLQLPSKMRFLSAQFVELFRDQLWLHNAQHANAMAKYLESLLKDLPKTHFAYPVEANAVFLKLPAKVITKLQEEFYFYMWDEDASVVRLMMSYETKRGDVEALATAIHASLRQHGRE